MPRRKASEVIDVISSAKVVNLDELAAELLDAFGGARGYAELCFKEFNAGQSPVARAKLLEGVRHIAVASAAKNKSTDDMSQASDDELLEAIELVTGKDDGEEESQT